jgi:ribosome-binding factor A
MRERGLPRWGEVSAADETDVDRFFGDGEGSRKGSWKVLQLCKQVERAATLALEGEWTSDALPGAAVASVEPAPDAGRLRVVVVLARAGGVDDIERARRALAGLSAGFRSEVARLVHRKRVPEIVFEVRLAEEVDRG